MGNERSLVTLTLISNESKERAKSEFGSSSISGFFPVFVWRNPVLFCHVDAGTSIFNNGIFLVFSGYRVHLDETGKLHRYSRLEYSFGYINASSGVSLLLSKTAKVISSLYDLFGANDYFSFNKLLHFGRRILGSLGQLATTKVDLLSRAIAEIKFQKMPSTFLGKADKYIELNCVSQRINRNLPRQAYRKFGVLRPTQKNRFVQKSIKRIRKGDFIKINLVSFRLNFNSQFLNNLLINFNEFGRPHIHKDFIISTRIKEIDCREQRRSGKNNCAPVEKIVSKNTILLRFHQKLRKDTKENGFNGGNIDIPSKCPVLANKLCRNKNLSQFHAFLRGLISNLSLATKFYSSPRRPPSIVF